MNEQLNNELQLSHQQTNEMSEELALTKQLVAQLEIKNTRLNQQAVLQQVQQRRASVDGIQNSYGGRYVWREGRGGKRRKKSGE